MVADYIWRSSQRQGWAASTSNWRRVLLCTSWQINFSINSWHLIFLHIFFYFKIERFCGIKSVLRTIYFGIIYLEIIYTLYILRYINIDKTCIIFKQNFQFFVLVKCLYSLYILKLSLTVFNILWGVLLFRQNLNIH